MAAWINHCSNLEVCGTAGGVAFAFHAIGQLHPDLVISEIMRPQDLGFIRKLHQRHPRLPILAFSFRDEEVYAPLALQAGTRGYLMKNVSGETLVDGIRQVLTGRVVLSPVMAARLRRKVNST